MSKNTVLVVDDDPVALGIAQLRLEQRGFRVILRGEALGTSTVILNEHPDVLLLDVHMPGLSGDLVAQLLAGNPATSKVGIIFCSGDPPESLQELVTRTNAVGAIQKTFDDARFMTEFDRLFALATSR